MTEHNQLPITNPVNNKIVYIDEDIISLIHILWNLKLETFNSCQDNNGYIWIEFEIESFKKFTNILLKYKPSLLENVLTGNVGYDWKYELIIQDDNEFYDKISDTIRHPNPIIKLTVSFRFYQEYYNMILDSVKKEYFNKEKVRICH